MAHLKWSLGLTGRACTDLDLALCVLKEWPHNEAAPGAVELDHLQLRKDARPSGHHTLELDKRVQVMLPAGMY